MVGKLRMAVLLLLVIPGLLFTASCSKKVVKADEAAAAGQGTGPGGTVAGQDDLARQQAIDEERLRQERLRQEEEERLRREREGSGTGFSGVMGEDIYFAYDSATLSSEAQESLRRKAEWLRSNSGVSVSIEGHCDERGTNEYNMALGDRRAESTKSFLVNLGIPASRINTVSYGEERPADPSHNESAWSKNRRAHFVTD